jgi:UDP-2,3-diacylglucosamine hydrolase
MNIIKEGAIFIADSHYPHHGNELLALLQKLDNGTVKTSQLFLMGDNLDLLFGYNDYIKTFSTEIIEILQDLSLKMEIHYFEGNHDFCLKELFPNISVYSRDTQPVFFKLGMEKVALSHGDKYATGFVYDLYCKILRNKITLTLLKPFEKQIINYKMYKLSKKKICHDFKAFEIRVGKILKHYKNADLVLEGHYHQSKKIDKYISLPSLACQGWVTVIEEGSMVFKVL